MDDRVFVLGLAVYATGNYDRIWRKRSYLVFYTGKKTGIRLTRLFDKYGIPYTAKVYKNKVGGKEYLRYKIVVRDSELISRVKEFLREKKDKLKWYIMRNIRKAREVLGVLKRGKGWKRIEELLGERGLMKLLGIKPFRLHVYRVFKNKKIVRELKPNWRFYNYVRMLIGRYGVDILYRLMDRYRYANIVVTI